MARIPDPALPIAPGPMGGLTIALNTYLKKVQQQINAMAGGSVSSSTAANSAPPAAGNIQISAKGDTIPNNNPTELGAAGSKFVITGWICVAGGQPGTWLQCRSLTGN